MDNHATGSRYDSAIGRHDDTVSGQLASDHHPIAIRAADIVTAADGMHVGGRMWRSGAWRVRGGAVRVQGRLQGAGV